MPMTHEDTMSHDIIRKQMTESTHFTISFAHLTDLLSEYDAVVAEHDRRLVSLAHATILTDTLRKRIDELEQERDQLRAIIREQVPYPASPDSNHSETPNSSTCKEDLPVDMKAD